MKKLLSLGLAVLLLLSLCACGSGGKDVTDLKNRFFPAEITVGSSKQEVLDALDKAGIRYHYFPDMVDPCLVFHDGGTKMVFFVGGNVDYFTATCSEDLIQEITQLLGQSTERGSDFSYAWDASLSGVPITVSMTRDSDGEWTLWFEKK